jgi:outer membrane protein insertion porin family
MRLSNAIRITLIAALCLSSFAAEAQFYGQQQQPAVSASPAVSAPAQDATQDKPAYVIGNLTIRGNQRVENSTILTYLNLKPGQPFTQYDIDAALKSLYATGFFADTKITPGATHGNTVDINVSVLENPVINKVAFEGNHAVEDKDLDGELELKPRSVFTRTKLQNDVKRILNIYRRGGRYSAQVNPKVIELDQNRINLVYEIQEGPVAKVEKIAFIGNDHFPSATLASTIRTEETRWYKFLTSDDKYDPERLQYDQELLRRFYTSQGYADFQVKSAIAELSPAKDAFYITFALDEGKKYTFGTVTINSALKGVNIQDLEKKLTTKAHTTFNASAIESSIDALTKELGNQGFAFVEIEPHLDRNPQTRIINLVYEIKQGPRVYVERINITGNVRTLDEVIRREMRLAEGDPYSTSKIARSEQRLNNLGFFEKVKITNEPGSAPDKTIINVNVTEKSTGEITLGGGFSTTDGPLAEAGIKETNLLGTGQDLRFNATVSSVTQLYDISYTQPYFLDRELAGGFDLFRTETYVNSGIPYQMTTDGVRPRLGYALSENWQQTLNYTLKKTTVGDVQPGASIFIIDQEGTIVESSVGQTLTYEGRDNKFTPTNGYYFRVSNDVAGLGGDADYLRTEVHTGYYYPVAPKWTLSVSGAGGYIFGFGQDVRIEDRFFLGGQSFPGFYDYGVGPHDKPSGDALGGNAYYTISPQLTFPLGLPEDLGFLGEVFVDAGNLWDVQASGSDVSDPNLVRVSAGVGVSWASPFGPIRVDLAKAIIKSQYDNTQIFQFNFGTQF